ncbi:MAG: NAD(P)/FAD-dependent oxidoreductase, partial [Candidatus Omnitrophica bacterium]|nr:NAD(P)/FAD-dependent oxidoreductase [Candidatus Omnitrophota bacterium]
LRVDPHAVELRQTEEDPSPVRAKVAVIATGFGSNLPLQVGLEGPRAIVYGAQAEVEMEGLRDVEIYLGRAVAPGAFAWVVPLEPGRARVGLTVSKEAPRYFHGFLRHPAVRDRIRTPEPQMLLSPIPTEAIRSSVADRVLVVGEAAGQVKTTTQGGIYYGMFCAAMAAETIEEAIRRDDFRARRLIRYERAWTRAIGQELKAGLSLRQLFSELSDSQIDAMVELGEKEDVIALVKRLAQFDWHRELIWSSLRLPALREMARGGLW